MKNKITLSNCNCCPRSCNINRINGVTGFCNTGDGYYISSICAHRGEEPVISGEYGICNIFFSHCNMQCIYCQNYQISDNQKILEYSSMSLSDIIKQIVIILNNGVKSLGFVSPSHSIPQMLEIIYAIKKEGHTPVIVYNSNGYDKPEHIKELTGVIDVYLPDLKYMDNRLSAEYSNTPDYVEFATQTIKEMYRQKGSDIILDNDGLITSGMIIRHLVLPGHVDNSKDVLRFIANELSPDVYISLMSQYYPTPKVVNHPVLGRTLSIKEYDEVLDEMENLGFHRGFVQELDSSHNYQPDFYKNHPFED